MSSLLSSSEIEFYNTNGYLILENFVPSHVCNLLREQAKHLINEFDPGEIKTIFSTKDQRHSKYQYFLDSGDKIRFFFEESALDEKGELKREKVLCINKIGHALHDLDPVFYSFSRSHKLAMLVNDLRISNPLFVQSMYICKQPHIGGEVTCHQDSTYLYVKEQPVTGFWFALENATLANGCLWAIPGGHRTPLKSRMFRNTSVEHYDKTPWELNKMTPLEVKQGSLIVLHGLLPHMSKENTSAQSRHAYTLHVMSGDCEYPSDNWLQRPNMPFSGFC